MCGRKDGLQVHHLAPKKQNPDLWLEKLDLLTLCRSCHFRWHHGHEVEGLLWIKRNKPGQWAWLESLFASRPWPVRDL